MDRIYEVRYIRNDGSFGAYCGDSKDVYSKEVNDCERLGYEYTASIKVGSVEKKYPEHGKTIAIHTPIGMLTAEACGSEQSYPGIQISLTTDGYSGKELVACAEYNADDEELRTECYAKGVDEPTSIIRNRDGVDILR